ncbi:hypothetical protein GWK47_035918 [Chionoecetes opilio]|uniref:Uncharacterized protein n=1 Tax=Chionoecetes opilio TaxID=41210 RepID=A0A8J4YGA9_CHIOP|nr:hypothetical protein GWK47_035918 [Chionoecetes opilio]
MATDTPDARMPPAASRYCYCVCDKKRRKHPGVRLQLFPKDARRWRYRRLFRESPLASAEIGLDVAAGEDSSTITTGNMAHSDCFDTDVGVLPKPQYQSQPPTT